MIAIVDYGMGNTVSMTNALERLGYESVVTSNTRHFARATHIIFPGVGAFGEGMKELIKRKLIPILEKEVLEKKKPFLGVCLGMQLMMTKGYEGGENAGLGWIKGTTRRLRVEKKDRLPHVGWDNVSFCNTKLFQGIVSNDFYFVHSFVVDPEDQACVVASCDYGESFVAAVEAQNIFGVQFHPEKSQKCGEQILKNFVNLC